MLNLADIDKYTTSLLHFDGADGSTTIVDEVGNTWTPTSHAQIDTAFSKFGGSSCIFEGDDILNAYVDERWVPGTLDFTVEAWIRRNGTSAYPGIISATVAGQNGWSLHLGNGDNKVRVIWDNTQKILSTGTIADLTWTHVALVRFGNTATVYINGVADGTDDCTGDSIGTNGLYVTIGAAFTNPLYYWLGWIDEVRFSKGIARWTADFIPPTREYPTTKNYLTNLRSRFRTVGVSLG